MTEYKRLVKYRLHPADVLFFRCIPGNGGELLYPLLEQHFDSPIVFAPYSASSEAVFSALDEEQRSHIRLVRGNLEYGTGDRAVYHYLSRNPIKMTLLCDPIRRAVSLHELAIAEGRISAGTTLREFVRSDKGKQGLRNAQAQAIVGLTTHAIPGHATLGYLPDAFMRLAEDNLDQHHFVGLAEDIPASLQLLSYTFDWDPIPPGSPIPQPSGQIDPEDRLAIIAQAAYDVAFYEYARSLFQERYRQMVAELQDLEASSRATARNLPQLPVRIGFVTRIARAIRRRLPGGRERKRQRGGSRKHRRAAGSGNG